MIFNLFRQIFQGFTSDKYITHQNDLTFFAWMLTFSWLNLIFLYSATIELKFQIQHLMLTLLFLSHSKNNGVVFIIWKTLSLSPYRYRFMSTRMPRCDNRQLCGHTKSFARSHRLDFLFNSEVTKLFFLFAVTPFSLGVKRLLFFSEPNKLDRSWSSFYAYVSLPPSFSG